MLDDPDQPVGDLEREILESIIAGKARSGRADAYSMAHATRGERLADRVAAVGGSWGFIITFGIILFSWMIINSGAADRLGLVFDPFPFIFLNLMLSMLAAIQAPIIMMSQNRQAKKDRLAARLDFETNLRAELDIERLHYKIDAILAERIDALSDEVAGQRDDPSAG
ncbi:MAG: DUF1003 domain-containing protein [Sphingomonas sp.]|nr:DUF1003 domain-containing protein [Sphingomonas sp.]